MLFIAVSFHEVESVGEVADIRTVDKAVSYILSQPDGKFPRELWEEKSY